MANFTKKAIRDSFVKLLNEKPISQITIRDIVDDCGVNRNTFYYYFEDLPQLIESIVNEDAERIIREHPTIDSMDDCINAALEFALANRRAVLHIYNSVNRDIYEQYQWRVCSYVVAAYVDGVLGDQKLTAEDHTTIVDYLKCVCFGMIMGWLETGMNPQAMDRFQRIFELKRGDLARLINRCEHRN
ncbi:MAG: TetR/AcrR family transcriptional regulator [Blautia sp.]